MDYAEGGRYKNWELRIENWELGCRRQSSFCSFSSDWEKIILVIMVIRLEIERFMDYAEGGRKKTEAART